MVQASCLEVLLVPRVNQATQPLFCFLAPGSLDPKGRLPCPYILSSLAPSSLYESFLLASLLLHIFLELERIPDKPANGCSFYNSNQGLRAASSLLIHPLSWVENLSLSSSTQFCPRPWLSAPNLRSDLANPGPGAENQGCHVQGQKVGVQQRGSALPLPCVQPLWSNDEVCAQKAERQCCV